MIDLSCLIWGCEECFSSAACPIPLVNLIPSIIIILVLVVWSYYRYKAEDKKFKEQGVFK